MLTLECVQDYRPYYRDVPFPNKPPFRDPEYIRQLEARGLTTLDVPIRAIGVWDTVGSLGIPRIPWLEKLKFQSTRMRDFQFYDTTINDLVENAFQALALDEQRSPFSPALWEKHTDCRTNLKQVWFPGMYTRARILSTRCFRAAKHVLRQLSISYRFSLPECGNADPKLSTGVHSNIGGGYPDQEIANISLAWMVSQLEPFIDFDIDTLMKAASDARQYYRSEGEKPRPWSFGNIVDSQTPVYTLVGTEIRTPGDYYRVDRQTGKETSKPLKNTHEYIHPSVRTRTCLDGPGIEDRGDYESKALRGWSVTVDKENINKKNSTVIWRAPRGLNFVNNVLPESILKETEWKMLEKSPEMYDYLAQDPLRTLGRR